MTFAEPSLKSLFLEIRFEGQVFASGTGIYRLRKPVKCGAQVLR